VKNHSPKLYVQPVLPSVGTRSKPPTRELQFALFATPRLVGLGLEIASGPAIARPLGCTDEAIYAMREGRLQPRFADVLAMPSRVARRILNGALHLLDVRVLPLPDFDDLLVLLFGQLHQILSANHQKPLEDCNLDELEDRAKKLREIHETSGTGLRQVERLIRQKRGEPLNEELNGRGEV
jgi:hypothetical protein